MNLKHSGPFVIGIIASQCCSLVIWHYSRDRLPTPMVLGVSVSPTTDISPTATPTVLPSPTLPPTLTPTKKPLPTKTPTPTPFHVTAEQLDTWFTTYSNHYSIERAKLWRMAVCESNLKPTARNGDYGGLYQFSTNTWIATRRAMNLDSNPTIRFNPEEAIKTAAFKISTTGLSAWPNCNK